MLRRTVSEVLVRLVGKVVEAPLAAEPIDRRQVRGPIDCARWVVGRDRDNGAGARRNRGFNCVEIELIGIVRSHEHGPAIGHADGHFVVEVKGRHHDDLIAWVGNGEQGVVKAHVGASRDHQELVVAHLDLIFTREFLAQLFPELGQAAGGLIVVFDNRAAETGNRLHGLRRRRIVHHALAERNSARVVSNEGGHVRNYRTLYRLQAL